MSLGDEAVKDYVKELVISCPNDPIAAFFLMELVPPEAAVDLLRPMLAQRPIRVELHRAYQELMDRSHSESDLYGEYKRYLDAEPQNATLIYLLGRTAPDRKQATSLFERAAAGNPPSSRAWYALAYDKLS